jgi:hypothetical protein
LTAQQRREENAMRDIPEPYDADDAGWEEYEDDVLRGRTAADISHAGEALNDDTMKDSQTLLEQLRAHHQCVTSFISDLNVANSYAGDCMVVDVITAQEQITLKSS